jgi:dipeptidase E
LAGGRKRALVIANACDLIPEPGRAPRVQREIEALEALGFRAEELDLREYFGSGTDALGARLDAADLIWARGGPGRECLRPAPRHAAERV